MRTGSGEATKSQPDTLPLPPFLTTDSLEGDPPCEWKDFLTPQLRRFPRADEKIRIQRSLGNGIEGCVARVQFGDDGASYALKIFFKTVPDSSSDWWSLEREARNAAILEKVSAGLRQASSSPVNVPAHRATRLDCLRCLHALSAEGRAARHFDSLPEHDRVTLSDSSTRLRKCYGWVRVLGRDMQSLNEHIEVDEDEGLAEKVGGSASYLQEEQEYFGLVYEFLEGKEELKREVVQRQLDFLYHIGFQPCQGVHADNWQGPGVLLDLGDYEAPVLREFQGNIAFHPCPDAVWIVDKEGAEKRAESKWEREEGGVDEVMKKMEKKMEKGGEPGEEGRAGTVVEEEESAEEKRDRALRKTAKVVESSYQEGEGSSGYCELKTEEQQEKGLLDDPLGHIEIPEIESDTLRTAWERYEQERERYLSEMKSVKGKPKDGFSS